MKPLIHFTTFLLFLILLLNACTVKKLNTNSQPISHEIWDGLLKKHVTETGKVNYKGFIKDSTTLNQYLQLLSDHHPNDRNWKPNERLAYWINAYNAFTVKLIIDNYPVESIKDIKKGIPFVSDVWEINFFEIQGKSYNLNDLEHGITRKRFNDPRIHAAFNCASLSCPRLRNEAFVAARLEQQLDDQMRYFINNTTKNQLDPNNPKLSKIFRWYNGDFKKSGKSRIEFINQYAETKINKGADIDWLDYKWELNE